MEKIAIIVALGILFVLFLGLIFILVFRSWYKKVPQGYALIVNKMKGTVIASFTGELVYPIFHKAEVMDITVKEMVIDRRGNDGLICQDNIRADIKVSFFVRVNPTEEDVIKVAQSIGCARASNPETLEELFQAKFSEALKTVGKKMDFVDLYKERDSFKEQIIAEIGTHLNGYSLEDAAIDYLEQTPKGALDPDNILDAQGIRKITDLTSIEAIQTNAFDRTRQETIRQRDVEADEKIFELDRQRADAEARQKREIDTIRAREKAETEKVQAEETLKAERARIATEEELAVANENKQRQIEIAIKNKERTIAVETERVARDRDLEATERERLVALKQIEKDKDLEVEKKNIQEVIRERVAVEKTVAQEQENIKDTVAFAGAERQRKVEVIEAEREAQEKLIETTKAAEARELAAKRLYEEIATMAEAEKVKAEKAADAKKLLAEGTIAEQAAQGLAQVKVQEAEARAIELTGKAKAVAETERHRAEAFGIEAAGTSEGKAIQAKGTAEATTMSAKYKAEAEGIAAKGGAEASTMAAKYQAEADGIGAKGGAEASTMAAKFQAEADGIDQKAEAMKKFDGVGREHEEFKIRIGMEERIQLAGIDVNRQIAEAQARVLAEAMKSAKIDIVGGGDDFVERFIKAISVGKTMDGFVANSQLAQNVGRSLSAGEGGIIDQVRELVSKVGLSSEDVKNLTVSAVLAKLAAKAGDKDTKSQIGSLQELAKKFGVEDLMAAWLAK